MTLDAFEVPELKRRLACMVYEALLLFGVLFVAGWLFDILAQNRHIMALRYLRQAWFFVTIGSYFIYFWSHSGQTLAMKTWRIILTTIGQAQVPLKKAIIRYLFAWMLFLPAMILAYALELKPWASIGVVVIGMALWALTILTDKNRQFLHDRIASTQLISV